LKRWSFLLLLGLFVLAATFLTYGLLRKLEKDQLFILEEKMVDTARAISAEAESSLIDPGLLGEFQTILRTTQNATGSRIRLLDADRNLVADSLSSHPQTQDQLRFRPEVQAAFTGRYGAYTRFSDETGQSLALFVAWPIKRDEQVLGAIYVSHSTDEILQQLGILRRSANGVLLALASGLFLAAILMTGKVQSTLAQLRTLTNPVSASDPEELPVTGDEQVVRISENFNRLISSLRQKVSELEAERSKTKHFLEDVAHELKTPITGLVGSVEALRSDQLCDTDRDRLLENVAKETARLSDMTARLLELQKLEYAPLRVEPFDLLSVAETVFDSYQRTADQKAVKLEIEGDGVEDAVHSHLAQGDAKQIQRVVENLVENAIRCCPSGSRVTIRLHSDGESSLLSVIDEGPGPPDSSLFERHRKGDNNSGSLGLGLAIASEIMQKHERELMIAKSESGGSIFTLSLQGVTHD
jgi:two-component system, OmpR family, sensor histidine kinase ChvG